MNYQLLLEVFASGSEISKNELLMLEIELYAQIESIKDSRTHGCLEIAPNYICNAALVCKGSFWITCLAAVLDKCSPPSSVQKAKGTIVFDELVRQGYVATD
tara:strand:- start:4999 stop:5304 length:306 start_codon:yes stop_codon:yes gene_type:complete